MAISGQCKSCGNQTVTVCTQPIKITRTGEIRPVGTNFCITCLSGSKTAIAEAGEQAWFYVWGVGFGVYLVGRYPSHRMAEAIANKTVTERGNNDSSAWVTTVDNCRAEPIYDVSRARH
jgi:hypothetical protein